MGNDSRALKRPPSLFWEIKRMRKKGKKEKEKKEREKKKRRKKKKRKKKKRRKAEERREEEEGKRGRRKAIQVGVWRSDDHDLPFIQVAVIHQSSREAFNRVLVQL